MSRDERVDGLVSRLLRGTISGQVEWSVDSPPPYLREATDEKYALFFSTHQTDVCVGVYEVRYRYYLDESNYVWNSSYGICIFKRYSKDLILDERNVSYLDRLIQQAQRSAYDAGNLIDNLFRF